MNPLALANADLTNAYGVVSRSNALEVWEGLDELMCNLAAAGLEGNWTRYEAWRGGAQASYLIEGPCTLR